MNGQKAQDPAQNLGPIVGTLGAGLVSTVGIVPLAVAGLILAGIGVTLLIYMLPLVIAGGVAIVTFFFGKWSGLEGWQLFLITMVSGVGALIVYKNFDVALWGVGLDLAKSTGVNTTAVANSSVEAQFLDGVFGAAGELVTLIKLLIGFAFLAFILIGLFMIRTVGGDPGSAIAGLFGMFMAGFVASDYLDVSIPGLSEATEAGTQSFGLLILFSVLAGTAVMVVTAVINRRR